jgi:DNA-binding SARP family transcriptional activator
MTTTARHDVRRPRGSAASAIAALLALLAIIAGPPLALVLAVGNPIPEQVTIAGSLSDDAIIGLLAAVVWAAWLQLVVVVTVEATAAVRGGSLPRALPGCGLQQHLARRLVVTASLLLAGTASLSITVPAATASAVTAPVSPGSVELPTGSATVVESAAPRAPLVSADPVAPLGAPMGAATANRGELWYEVAPPHGRHHDSLWDIAERHLGDGLRWREIYDLNRHREQPDGQRLEQPRLIYPGWRLLMPADATGLTAARRERTESVEAVAKNEIRPSAEKPASAENPQGRTPLPHPRAAEVGPIGAATRAAASPIGDLPEATPSVGSTGIPSPAGTAVAAAEAHAADDDPSVNLAGLTLGLCAVSAAGLLAELARRRRRAQRLRSPGERLSRPTEQAASAERRLRGANAEITVAVLRDALRELAAGCRAIGRPLPEVELVFLNAEQAKLRLRSDDLDPIAPFVASDSRTWVLDNQAIGTTVGGEDAEYEAVDPYPALAALGVTSDAVVLVNLEAAGCLSILGDPAQAAPILHAVIADLGTSLLASSAQLAVAGCPPQLTQVLDHGRVAVLAPGQEAKWATGRLDGVASVLASAGLSTVHAARSMGLADDVWGPAVLVCGPGLSADLSPEPHRGLCLVAVTGERKPVKGWTLASTGGIWRLEPHGIELVPQRLDLTTLDAVGELLDTADQPSEPGLPSPLEVESALTTVRAGDGPTVEATRPTDDAAVRGPVVPSAPDSGSMNGATTLTPPETGAPRVLLLGPVEILGASDDLAPGRRGRAKELVAYLTLHPNASQHQLDEALWPGCRVSRNTRNPLVSRTRQWLGTGVDGLPYLGLVADEGAYCISPEVSSDWREFRSLAAHGVADGGAGVEYLVAALELVRGRPFSGVNPAAYGWAEADTQDMISCIVDTAHALAEISLKKGEYRRARWAAARGLVAEPCAEILYQDALRAAKAMGDADDVQHLVRMLQRELSELDPDDDVAAETGALISES